MWVSRRPDKSERRGGGNRLRTIVWKNENRWGGGYFEFNELRASSSTEQNENEPENVSSTEESEVVKPSATFPMVDLDYDIAEKTIPYIQFNHVEKPKTKNIDPKKI